MQACKGQVCCARIHTENGFMGLACQPDPNGVKRIQTHVLHMLALHEHAITLMDVNELGSHVFLANAPVRVFVNFLANLFAGSRVNVCRGLLPHKFVNG